MSPTLHALHSETPETALLPYLSDGPQGVGSLTPNETHARIAAILAIFLVSLFAVSFPALSKRASFLRIPRIVFFIGKHFGTGVILSTAFTHLLQDAFEALMDPAVRARWRVGKHTGLIVLGSLLSIFLVEYISTSYVDRLQSYSSPSITPGTTPRTTSPSGDDADVSQSALQTPVKSSADTTSAVVALHDDPERLPLLRASRPPSLLPCAGTDTDTDTAADVHGTPHAHAHTHIDGAPHPEQHQAHEHGRPPRHHDDPPHSHHPHPLASLYGATASHHSTLHTHTHPHDPARPCAISAHGVHHAHAGADADSAILEGHHRHEPRAAHSLHHDRGPRLPSLYGPEEFGQGRTLGVGGVHDREGVAGGHGHHGHGHAHGFEEEAADGRREEGILVFPTKEVKVGRKRQIVGILVLQLGIMIHSLVIGLTLAITSGPEFASLLIAVTFHQLFEGLSLGIRIASLPSSSSTTLPQPAQSHAHAFDPASCDYEHEHDHRGDAAPLTESEIAFPEAKEEVTFVHILKPTLACLFAITTPVGIGLGMVVFRGDGSDRAHVRLTQGLMSAISAGMLIYAACVEMLAADFVMDPTLWRSGWVRQAVAVGSLIVGAVAMGAIS